MYQMHARLEASSKMPEHRHPQKQIVHILQGQMVTVWRLIPRQMSIQRFSFGIGLVYVTDFNAEMIRQNTHALEQIKLCASKRRQRDSRSSVICHSLVLPKQPGPDSQRTNCA